MPTSTIMRTQARRLRNHKPITPTIARTPNTSAATRPPPPARKSGSGRSRPAQELGIGGEQEADRVDEFEHHDHDDAKWACAHGGHHSGPQKVLPSLHWVTVHSSRRVTSTPVAAPNVVARGSGARADSCVREKPERWHRDRHPDSGSHAESQGDMRLGLLFAMAMFVLVVDTSLMNVSISAVVTDLGTTASGVQIGDRARSAGLGRIHPGQQQDR